MACQITFREREVQLNNRHFSDLMVLVISVAETSRTNDESGIVDRLRTMNETEFWPGRGIEIETDFPDVNEQKFWCRTFFNTARAIVHGAVGNRDHTYWQAQATHQAYSIAMLFEFAVRTIDPDWRADTLDRIEFDRVVNRIER
jgi:hypothetical protein